MWDYSNGRGCCRNKCGGGGLKVKKACRVLIGKRWWVSNYEFGLFRAKVGIGLTRGLLLLPPLLLILLLQKKKKEKKKRIK